MVLSSTSGDSLVTGSFGIALALPEVKMDENDAYGIAMTNRQTDRQTDRWINCKLKNCNGVLQSQSLLLSSML